MLNLVFMTDKDKDGIFGEMGGGSGSTQIQDAVFAHIRKL